MLRIAFCFIPSAMTEFIAYVFLYPNRVPLKGALEVLEPDDGKLSCPVLRGPNPSNGVRLLDTWPPRFAADAGGYVNSIVGRNGVKVCRGCAAERSG